MAISDQYRRQVSLLIQCLPFIADETCFALKGGTAINLFFRDLPRLSVDIDLTFLPVKDRQESLAEIGSALKRIAKRISTGLTESRIHEGALPNEEAINKLTVNSQNVHVKIEVTPVLRGCAYRPEVRSVTPRVEEEFGFVETQVVSFEDLYAGKIVAALDRQHPRDLFDVGTLLANEGIDKKLRSAFIVYLLSHNRPMAEVLAPSRKNLAHEFERSFRGMTRTPVDLDQLIDVRERLLSDIVGRMPQAHKDLLVSFEAGKPDWSLLDVPQAENLPAVRWRMQNLAKAGESRRAELLKRLRDTLAT